ncbi:hypothetical protein [Sphingobium sp. YG1]|uniref:hypothetical protein n=1 Tax=Sphingobium sp. YG1 TaxID=2082188 RepID=UPI000DBB381D|nr:hypothetical protein [Sphingobium sp. YG1]BBD01506.1 hypothetical protein YGS_C1P2761 [Sphingobium sp. YG1]
MATLVDDRLAADGPRLTGLVLAPPTIVAMMERLRADASGISVMAQFGISDNSWRKLRLGKPVRASMIERLLQRLEEDCLPKDGD